MSDLSDDARALIAATRHGDDPRPADEDRVRRAVLLRVGATAVAGAAAVTLGRQAIAAGTAKGGLAWSTLLGSGGVKLLAAVALGGTVTATGYVALRHKPVEQETLQNPPRVAAQPSAVVSAPLATAADSEAPLAVDDLPVASTDRAGDSRPTPMAPRKPSNLMAEVAAVGSANRSLREGNPEEALRILDAHAGMLQDGTLREETAVSRILALCQLGRAAEAKVEAMKFLQAWPSSPLVPRVKASCAFSPTETGTTR